MGLHLEDLPLPLGGQGGPGGVSSIGDGVEDPGYGAVWLVDICQVPLGQHLLQTPQDHTVLVTRGREGRMVKEREREWERDREREKESERVFVREREVLLTAARVPE